MAGAARLRIVDEAKGKVGKLCRKIAHPVKSIITWTDFIDKVNSLSQFFNSIWHRMFLCSSCTSSSSCYRFVIICSNDSKWTSQPRRRRRHINDCDKIRGGSVGDNDTDNCYSGSNGDDNCKSEVVIMRAGTDCSTSGSSSQQQQQYRRLRQRRKQSCLPAAVVQKEEEEEEVVVLERSDDYNDDDESDSDLVPLKISCLGDCQTGKTTFIVKYIGDEQEKKSLQMRGLNLMDKTLRISGGATIAFSIWDVGGEGGSSDHLPIACKDAVAILFMFDLTSRCTLQNVIGWYNQARKWNKTAIPVLIGTKFDDYSRLPPDLQLTIITQARAYARAMKATLFFSSATHNINVNKIFKFIMARLFNLPWTLHKNLAVGEPIIDFF